LEANMRRAVEAELVSWKAAPGRKPLIVRGARQVGKTWSLRKFGGDCFDELVAVDLESMREVHRVFAGNLDATTVLAGLETATRCRITPGKTLLFLDEIQACPRAIVALRYLYEERSELHVVAAGSLLEFALGGISFPVGRVQFLEMYPLTFREFLWALGNDRAAEMVSSPPQRLAPGIHEMLLGELRKYCFVGGMPESVLRYEQTGSLQRCAEVQADLAATIREDFPKYAGRADTGCLDAVLEQLPHAVGRQITYTRLARDYSGPTAKKAFELLHRARIARRVRVTGSPRLPLAATASGRRFKAIALDVGMWHRLSGLRTDVEYARGDLLDVYRGAMAEQLLGQEMLVSQEGNLFYWAREARSSQAEVDYLAVVDGRIYGVEVKSGAAGRLRSLHRLLEDHPNVAGGLVFSSRPYEQLPEHKLTFLPLYYACSATGGARRGSTPPSP
jgi:predicted AAA+ superfamily ATPase